MQVYECPPLRTLISMLAEVAVLDKLLEIIFTSELNLEDVGDIQGSVWHNYRGRPCGAGGVHDLVNFIFIILTNSKLYLSFLLKSRI